MRRDLSIVEAFFIAVILLLLLFVTLDHTMFRAMQVEFLALQEKEEPEGPIKFTFVDLPEDRETENPDARLYSDISRRASGGSGPPADQAASKGNTPEIVMRPSSPATPEQPRVRPSPYSRLQAAEEQAEAGKTAAEEAGNPAPSMKPQPRIDMSKLFSATNPEIYNNPDGGLTIPGNFSIDTQGFDLGPYAKRIQQIVRGNWKVPGVARTLYLRGRVEVTFTIDREGNIGDIQVARGTGFEPLDKSAELAIRYSHPLPPLPSFVPKDKINVKWTFYYNERPED